MSDERCNERLTVLETNYKNFILSFNAHARQEEVAMRRIYNKLDGIEKELAIRKGVFSVVVWVATGATALLSVILSKYLS